MRDARSAASRCAGAAARRGCLTIGFAPADADGSSPRPTDDPFVRQELVETLYHVLWELVHVFFEHRGLLEGRAAARARQRRVVVPLPLPGEARADLEAVVADVRASVR